MLSVHTPAMRRLGWFCPTSRGVPGHLLAPLLVLLFSGAVHAAGPVFSALLGGSGQDFATSVTSDAQGNTYVAGLTYSPDFPVTPGAVQTKFGGTCDAFVAKLDPDGKRIWSTYLGGILDDWATGIALDSAGNVLVTGYTRSANFPLANAIQSTLDQGTGDEYDGFVAKLDPTGAKLLYSTFLGGIGLDGAAGIAAGRLRQCLCRPQHGNLHSGFPGIPNSSAQVAVVVSKLDPQGELIYSFLHPYGTAAAIAVDSAGSAYVAGTASTALPTGADHTFGPAGNAQAMVFKISPDGTKKIYETTLGGSVRADASAIAVDSAGEAYVAGGTSSVDFPLMHPLQSSAGARPLWKSPMAEPPGLPATICPSRFRNSCCRIPPHPPPSTRRPAIWASSKPWMAAPPGSSPIAASPAPTFRASPSIPYIRQLCTRLSCLLSTHRPPPSTRP